MINKLLKLVCQVEHLNRVFKDRVMQLKGQYTDISLDLIARWDHN